jgi:hypothetical protein
MNYFERQRHNKRLYNEAENLLRRIRQSPKLWEQDSGKIDRVLEKAKARMLRRMLLNGAREWPRDRMLDLYA